MKTISLILLAACVALAVADSEFNLSDESLIEPRIVGGQPAKAGQFPYQVSLRTRFTRQHYCGASIISNRYLLTAAHCTEGINSQPALIVAVVGAVRRHFDGASVKVDKIIRHSEWDRTKLANDIALIRTASEIAFSANVQPIALPSSNVGGNAPLLLSGWGARSFPSITLPNQLQYAEPQSLTNEDCVSRFKGQDFSQFVRETSLCTVNKDGVGACHGDSGGPLVDVTNPDTKVLAGVVSWGVPCAKGYPDVYTRVYSFLDWIKQNM